MTRFFSAILAFYLTLAIVQIPYVQALIPEYVKEITATEDDYVEDAHYVSIIVPEKDFDPQEEDQEVYSQKLSPIKYDDVAGLLKRPEVRQESHDSYYFKIDNIDIPISLYTGQNENQVTEIEFQIPLSQLDKAEKVVKAMAEMAKGIQGSQFFDYSGKNLYETKDKDALVKAILKNK